MSKNYLNLERSSVQNSQFMRDIFIDNSENILKILEQFSKNIDDFKKAIIEKNGDKLLKMFSSTKIVRKEIIKAGQDVKSPDFGRKKN